MGVVLGKPKRQFRSRQERRAIVEETLKPGASVSVVARAHDVNANQVFGKTLSSFPNFRILIHRCARHVHRKCRHRCSLR